MSGAAHRGDHDIAYYEARIGHTFALTTAGAATPAFVNEDADGPIPAARYLIQLASVSVPAVVAWIGFSAFEAGDTAGSVAGAGPARIPLSQSTIIAIETHVLEAADDRITVETIGGTGTVYVTRVSSLVPKAIQGV